jgi:hypothetical protein
VAQLLGMWWLICWGCGDSVAGDVVAQLRGCGGSVVGDVVAQLLGMWWLSCGDVVAQLLGMWWLSWLRRDFVNQTVTQQFRVRSRLPPQSPDGRQEL